MKRIYSVRRLFACFAIIVLILDSETALEGASEGLQMIIQTVLPSLFPFFFLSTLLTSTQNGMNSRILQAAGKLFHIPGELSFLLLPGFLGGYPAGAQTVTAAWEQGTISKDSAERMLAFCNNAGPSFLFGILASKFPDKWMAWALWGLHIIGALIAAQLMAMPSASPEMECTVTEKPIPEVLFASMKVMASVSGWLLLFRVLIAFLDRWIFWILPVSVRVLVSGLLELANGCFLLEQIMDIRLRFVVCTLLLSLGGLCVLLQSVSVTHGLSLRYYFYGKLVQASFGGCIATALMYRSIYPMLLLLVSWIPLMKCKKSSSIPAPAVV